MPDSLAKRSITAVKWNVIGSGFQITLGFIGSVILARLLPIDVFGIYVAAHSIVLLVGPFAEFGTGPAFIHRSNETLDLEYTARVHLSLKLIITSSWGIILLVAIFLLVDNEQSDLRTALIIITLTQVFFQLAQTPRLILTRRVEHTRLATIQVVNSIVTFIVTVGMAVAGFELWALLWSNIISAAVNIILLYVWKPIWRPRLSWSWKTVGYFLRYGSQVLLVRLLSSALDRIDDILTGGMLGSTALGFYSRAYTFAKYPSFALATPITKVAAGTYAELKGQRQKLSSAFIQINGLMARTGFYLAGLLYIIAPEFIVLIIGEKWLPMLTVFRLMLLFTLFDPMRNTIGGIFLAVGRPGTIVWIHFVQLIILLVGLPIAATIGNIEGVAIVVDAMLIVGIGLMLWVVRHYVDYSLLDLFMRPLIALVLALVTALAITSSIDNLSLWSIGAIKFAAFSSIYITVLLIIDRQALTSYFQLIKRYT